MRPGRPLRLGSGYRLAALRPEPPRSGPGSRPESRSVVLTSLLTADRRAWGVCQRRVSATGPPRANCRAPPPHQFVIDRDEARGGLFKNVASPEPAEQLLVDALGEPHTARSTKCSSCAILLAGRRKKEEIADIKIRKRTRTVREIEREHRKETSAGGYAGNSPGSSIRVVPTVARLEADTAERNVRVSLPSAPAMCSPSMKRPRWKERPQRKGRPGGRPANRTFQLCSDNPSDRG